MRLFKQAPKQWGESVAIEIMQHPDRIAALHLITDNLPPELVAWYFAQTKYLNLGPSYTEVDIAQGIVAELIIPGDLIITKNRSPIRDDKVKVTLKNEDGSYWSSTVRVLSVNPKDGTFFAENYYSKDARATLSMTNILGVIDKVIKFEDDEWKKLTNHLNIEYDLALIESWIKSDIEYLKKNEFHNKEKHLKLLQERLKNVLKQNDRL